MPDSLLADEVVKAGAKFESALESCIAALRHVAAYQMDMALNRRLRSLGERKESLSTEEREELLSLVALNEQRSIEKLEATLALQRLRDALPDRLR